MESDIGLLASHVRGGLVEFIGESPEAVLAVHALESGLGRAWVSGAFEHPRAVIVESALVPGEPQGFGDPASLVDLLAQVEGWSCIELTREVADHASEAFTRRWGIARQATDVIHAAKLAFVEVTRLVFLVPSGT